MKHLFELFTYTIQYSNRKQYLCIEYIYLDEFLKTCSFPSFLASSSLN